MTLLDIIKDRIAENGPIPVSEYMSLCLAHPEHGYYMKRDPLGKDGDFITSPEISQIFGELLGLWLASQWEKQGKPNATLLEMGPGRGTLMNDALRATKKIKGFHDAVSVRLLEISPALKQKQWQLLAGKHPDLGWLESLDSLPPQPLFVVANEFFDALPIRQFQYLPSPLGGEGQGEGWYERLVTSENGQLKFITDTKSASHLSPPTQPSPSMGEGFFRETCEPATEIISKLASHIKTYGGAALIIDYGYNEGGSDTLQAMRRHQYFEIFSKPGSADITAHVDFAALKEAAEKAGAKVFGATPQGRFLMKIGAGQRTQKLCAGASAEQSKELISGLDRLASPEKMGELFKVLAILPPDAMHAEGF
ncbi:MAG: SAM-dependent methyltransferase [Alphaproteobacteria bacterium]|nr:SAM-dependent methyltransferase [Alphaproteobacteria bacterium]